jgi:hypothetical protein
VNAILESKKSGLDIGNFSQTLAKYEKQAKANAYALTTAVEFVKNSYDPKFVGSEILGSAMGVA